jgi:diaminopimelate epimerase
MRQTIRFHKYHGLGNDYIVIHPDLKMPVPTPEQIRRICHRNFGIGGDGILLGPLETEDADFCVRIFNPDGSEAEKSGNGLRIFSQYLADINLVTDQTFTIATIGGIVKARIDARNGMISVVMGTVSFNSRDIPVAGEERDVINEIVAVGDEEVVFTAAAIGNPHCVIFRDSVSPELARTLGPQLETHPLFPNRTNVQFARVMDRGNLRIEIWERGAGYTLASGSSASASAAAAHRLGLTDAVMTVHMPGGRLGIRIDEKNAVTLTGPVTRVASGVLYDEMFRFP